MRCSIKTLTYDLVDGIEAALEDDSAIIGDLPQCRLEDVSPALELHHCRPEIFQDELNQNSWLDVQRASPLLNAIYEGRNIFVTSDGCQGMISVACIESNQFAWTEFAIKLKTAAVVSDFTADHAGKLLAAIQEFYSNVIEHSQRVSTGQVLFASRKKRFEFVVRDKGIGILKSLQKNPDFISLDDHGTAIEHALEDGVSRYSDARGRGFGFRPLFVGLANISAHMRFRSGDHCREYLRNADKSIDAYTKQSGHFEGFGCTVICTPNSV